MSKVYLISDFIHKNFIKSNGGKWDAERSQWYLIKPTNETLDKILKYGMPTYWSVGENIYPRIDTSNKKTVDLFVDSDDE